VALGKNLWHRQSPSARILHRATVRRKKDLIDNNQPPLTEVT
jgi:hypothetical protein